MMSIDLCTQKRASFLVINQIKVTYQVKVLVDVWIQEKTLSPLTNLLNTEG
jgi:hypothetical protein